LSFNRAAKLNSPRLRELSVDWRTKATQWAMRPSFFVPRRDSWHGSGSTHRRKAEADPRRIARRILAHDFQEMHARARRKQGNFFRV
jgi:hypothetical protein